METILKGITRESVLFSERLLLSGMLLAAVDGRVVTIEKKLLAQASQLLGISRERYSEIAKDAVHLIKIRNKNLSGNSTSPQEISAPTVSVTNEERQQIPQHVETTEAPSLLCLLRKASGPQSFSALVRTLFRPGKRGARCRFGYNRESRGQSFTREATGFASGKSRDMALPGLQNASVPRI